MIPVTTNNTFLLLTFFLFVVIFGIGTFSDGMFFDGIQYANVANNYANGLGSFWNLYNGNNANTEFHSQPPLGFFLLAQFYKVLGDSIYVERLYDFVFAILHLILIKFLWEEVTDKENRLYWLPMLLWISIPLCSWTFKNNLLEITMGALDLAAVLFLLKGCKQNKIIFLLAGSGFILLASLSKGIQGIFPIMIPVFYWLVYRRTSMRRLIPQEVLTVSIPAIAYTYFYFTPETRESIGLYLEERIAGTFNHLQDTKTSHFYLFFKLLLELTAPVVVVIIAWLAGRKAISNFDFDKKGMLFFIMTGLSASLPLMVTLEQRAFYLTTSLPYYVLALALIAQPYVQAIINRLSGRNTFFINRILIGLILISVIFIALNAHKPKRDHELLSDLYIIREYIPRGITISMPPEMYTQWAYHHYFIRYAYIALDGGKHQYYLSERTSPGPADTCYHPVDLPLKKFQLYNCADWKN